MTSTKPTRADRVPEQSKQSSYPEPYASLVRGRTRRRLGDYFQLSNFGVNLTELAPGSMSALKHRHSRQDELVYVLAGTPTLIDGDSEYTMKPGDCVGFRAGRGSGHHLVNRTDEPVTYLEIGDRTPDDEVTYPDDDLRADYAAGGVWIFSHKDGTPY